MSQEPLLGPLRGGSRERGGGRWWWWWMVKYLEGALDPCHVDHHKTHGVIYLDILPLLTL